MLGRGGAKHVEVSASEANAAHALLWWRDGARALFRPGGSTLTHPRPPVTRLSGWHEQRDCFNPTRPPVSERRAKGPRPRGTRVGSSVS